MISDLEFIKEDYRNISFIENPSEELCIEAIKIDSDAINFIKDECMTTKMLLALVEKDGTLLIKGPIHLNTQEIYFKSIKRLPNNIHFVPDEFLTEEMCLIAFEGNVDNFMYIPNKFLTEEIILKAISDDISLFAYVKNKTPKIWEEAIKRYPELYHKHRNPPQELTDLYNLLTL